MPDLPEEVKAPEGIEQWMVDYEHGDGEPQHAVLSWDSEHPAEGLPEVGTLLIRVSDLPTILAAERERVKEQLLSEAFEKRVWKHLPPSLKAPTLWRTFAEQLAAALDSTKGTNNGE